MFLRFVVQKPTFGGHREGVFPTAYALLRQAQISDHDLTVLCEAVEWIEQNIPKPTRFARSFSKGEWRRETGGLSWFKDSAHEAINHMRTIARILDAHDLAVSVISTKGPGYIVYEDDVQVVGEPFADTQT